MRSLYKTMSAKCHFRYKRLLCPGRHSNLCWLRKMYRNMSCKCNYTKRESKTMKTKKNWYDFLWIWAIIYFALGFFNILFAWLGLIDFMIPLFFSIFAGNKFFCNNLCGRGQLLNQLGSNCHLSRNKPTPKWMTSKVFRYAFLIFFLTMFANMIFQTYLTASNAKSLSQVVKLFWTFKIPWHWAYSQNLVSPWIAQFSYGFYSLMLTSTIIGIIVMILYKPRSWCTFCPMGTMTQTICKIKNRKAE